MAQKDRSTLKGYFETGDFPTQQEFADFIDSVLNFVDDGSPLNEVIQLSSSDLTKALTTGTGKAYVRMPYAMTLTEVRASLIGAGSTSGTTTVDINQSGTTILSTKLTIDFGDKTSTTAATEAVISNASLADDAEITIDIDALTGGEDEIGLIVTLIGVRA